MKYLALALTTLLGACAAPPPEPPAPVTLVAAIDTLFGTDAPLLSGISDLDVSPSGELYVLDGRSAIVYRVAPSGEVESTFGKRGDGPGEFQQPHTIRALNDGLLVADAGNLRLQRLSRDGTAISTNPLHRYNRSGRPYLFPDGSMLIPTSGRDSSLALRLDISGATERAIGAPVVPPPDMYPMWEIKERIQAGQIPDELRNEALVSANETGKSWIALQVEAEVRRFDAMGNLIWSAPMDEPEMAAAREQFFKWNREDANPNRFASLRYFSDLQPVGEDLWLLLNTGPRQRSVVIVLDRDGNKKERLELDVEEVTRLAVDVDRRRLFMASSADARVYVAEMPGDLRE